MNNDHEIKIYLLCRNLPGPRFDQITGVRLGIQQGKDVVKDVPADAENVTFDLSLRVQRNAENGKPNFLGPFAQGNVNERFIYLCWGQRRDGDWDRFRRAKVHLRHLEWESVEKALEASRPMVAVIDMTDDKGGPLSGSVREDKIEWKI